MSDTLFAYTDNAIPEGQPGYAPPSVPYGGPGYTALGSEGAGIGFNDVLGLPGNFTRGFDAQFASQPTTKILQYALVGGAALLLIVLVSKR